MFEVKDISIFSKNTIKDALTWNYLIMVVVSLILLGSIISYMVFNQVKDSYLEQGNVSIEYSKKYVDYVNKHIDNYAIEIFSNIRKLSSLKPSTINSIDRYEEILSIENSIRHIATSNDLVDSIYFISEEGLVLGYPSKKLNQEAINQFKKSEYYQAVWNNYGKSIWLPPHVDTQLTNDRIVLSYVRGLRKFENFEEEGLLIINLDATEISNALTGNDPRNLLEIVVADVNGIIIMHRNPEKLGTEIRTSYSVFNEMKNQTEHTFMYVDDVLDERLFSTYVKDEDIGWSYIGIGKYRDILAPSFNILKTTILAVLFVMAIMLYLSAKISKMIANPIAHLIEATQNIKNDEFQTIINEEFPYELHELKEHFNSMVMHIEERVLERTDELSTTNQQLIHAKAELENSISLLNETQRKLVESKKMASLNDMFVGISHELNTPIGNAITLQSYANEKLEEEIEHISTGKVSKYVLIESLTEIIDVIKIMGRNLFQSRHIIDKFKISTENSGSHVLEEINLKDLMEKAFINCSFHVNLDKVSLQFKLSGNVNFTTFPGIVTDVFESLINNAGLHAFENMDNPIIQMSVTREDGKVSLTIRDNGCGISSDRLVHVFDPYYSTQFSKNHLGLGLYEVYTKVTVLLSGEISMDSVVGEYTQISITLPEID